MTRMKPNPNYTNKNTYTYTYIQTYIHTYTHAREKHAPETAEFEVLNRAPLGERLFPRPPHTLEPPLESFKAFSDELSSSFFFL